MVVYSTGMRVFVALETLQKLDMDPEMYIDDTVEDCVICTVLRLIKGRTWLVELPDG